MAQMTKYEETALELAKLAAPHLEVLKRLKSDQCATFMADLYTGILDQITSHQCKPKEDTGSAKSTKSK